jgi:hypothetical protein
MPEAAPPDAVPEPKKSARTAKVEPFVMGQLEDVFKLYRTVFGAEGAAAFRARFRWSQEENGLPEKTLRWVLVDGPRVVGFLATIPQRFRIAGADVLVHYSCDYMVHPDYRFYGIALMREYFRACDNCVSLDDVPATIAVLKMMKAKPIAQAHRYVRVLDARAARGRVARLDSVPDAAFMPATWALAGYDLAQSARGPRVRELSNFDERFDRFFERTMDASAVSLVRDAAYLRWRYGASSPHRARRIGVVTDDSSELLGYVVCCASGSKSDPTGYVFELAAVPHAPASVFRALLTFASRRIRQDGGYLARMHWLPGATSVSETSLAAGHFARRKHQHVLLAKLRDESMQAKVSDPAVWRYSFGDSEASHSVGVDVPSDA